MKYSVAGFRAVYKQFCCFPIRSIGKKALKGFPGLEECSHVLVYGYYDKNAGMSLECIACAKKQEDSFTFFKTNNRIKLAIRIEFVEDVNFYPIHDTEILLKKYKEKIESLKEYDANEEVEASRNIKSLDESRDPVLIDDVLVYLLKDGLEPEACWVRITGLGEDFVVGDLLNEPRQDFLYHLGEEIAFNIEKKDTGEYFCVSILNIGTITYEELADGNLLKQTIINFNKDRTEKRFITILEILRDSYVWIPCVPCQKENEDFLNKEEVEEDLLKLKDLEFESEDEIEMEADILQSDDGLYFPVFSSKEEMGEYGDGFIKIKRHFLDVLDMAKENENNVKGIVVNAFSESYLLPIELFDVFDKIKSRIKTN